MSKDKVLLLFMADLLKKSRAVSLLEILLSLVLLSSIFVGLTSIIYSASKQGKKIGLDTVESMSLGFNFAFGEFGKISVTTPPGTTSVGVYNQIGDEVSPSNFSLWRSRVDLDGDGVVDANDPVFVYMELI